MTSPPIKDIYLALKKFKKRDPISLLYENAGIPKNSRTEGILPFLKVLGTNTQMMELASFKTFLIQLARVFHLSHMIFSSQMMAKSHIKKYMNNYDKIEDKEYYDVYYTSPVSYKKEDFDRKKDETEKIVTAKNEDVVTVPASDVESLAKFLIDLEPKDAIDNIILSQLASGTRLIEILQPNVSKWAVTEDGDLQQTGVAKGKCETKVIIKTPLFISGAEFINLIKNIHEKFKPFHSLTNAKLTAKINNKLNNRIKKYNNKHDIDHKQTNSSHGLRKLHVAYSYFKRKNKKLSFILFYQQCLGHIGYGSIANYSTVMVE